MDNAKELLEAMQDIQRWSQLPQSHNSIGASHRLNGMLTSNYFRWAEGEKYLFSNREKLDPENIEKIIFNEPATIIIFKDGTKEISKVHNEEFDEEKGVAMIMLNLMFDNNKSERKRFLEQFSRKLEEDDTY